MSSYNGLTEQKAKRITKLLSAQLRNDLTAVEREELDAWTAESARNQSVVTEMNDAQQLLGELKIYSHSNTEVLLTRVKRRIAEQQVLPLRKSIKLWSAKWTAVAAMFAIMLTAGLYFYHNNPKPTSKFVASTKKVNLRLANGQSIDLNTAKDGIILADYGIKYADGSTVLNKNDKQVSSSATALNVLSIPNGMQYKLVLSDGTKVWLNAASKIKYPSRFTGNSRKVEIEGEVYFEVVSNKKKPFKVLSRGQEITVVGTVFNVNSYADEEAEVTSLVSGKVWVTGHKTKDKLILNPGQASVLTNTGLTMKNADLESALSWKNGKFSFENKTFKQVMGELARWYDLEIVYQGAIPKETFFGGAYRTSNLSIVLRLLESADVQYHLENNNKLIITNTRANK